MTKHTGLDGRHRDKDGRIDKKHGNALVGNLRKIYGDEFAKDHRADKKLENVLKDEGVSSLSELIKRGR